MKLSNNIEISPVKEGLNILRAWFSVISGKMLSRPVSVNLLPTMECNSRCIMCDSWKIRESGPRIELPVYEKLAVEMKEMEIPYVTIGGGEPLMHRGICEILEIFKKNRIAVQLTTNGFTLNDEVLEKLLDAGLSRLTFSIDSHLPEVYRAIRGVDWFPKVLANIENSIRKYGKKISVETNTVICAKNIGSFLDTVRFFLEKGVNKICFSAVTVAGDNYLFTSDKDDLAKIEPDAARRLAKGLLKLKKKYPNRIAASSQFIEGIVKYVENPRRAVFSCYAGFLTLDILYDGQVHSCGNLPSFGNIKNNTLKEIWYSMEAMKSRKAMARKNCPSCYTSCKIELALLASPLRGIAYFFEKIRETL